ncbi:MAG: hypothetical protein MJ247_03445 [Alphaproteobacteria bacterium]|nr:hypothetical protein [Alphaproteobacteria bacterium]
MRLIFFNDKIVWKKNLIKVLKKERLLALCVFKMLLETVLIAAVICCVVLVVLKKIDTIPQLPTKYLYSLAGAMVPYLLIRQSLRIPACVAENEDVGFIEGWRTTSNYGLSYSFIYFVVALMPFMVSALLLSPLGFSLFLYNFVFIFMIFVSIFLQVGLMSYSYFYVKNAD